MALAQEDIRQIQPLIAQANESMGSDSFGLGSLIS
jgi:hypothetical protein